MTTNPSDIDVSDIKPAALLAALYNRARAQGMGFFAAQPDMTEADAEAVLAKDPRGDFDYLHGRAMKVQIGEPVLDAQLYDRDNGRGAAQSVVDALRRT